MSKTRAAVIVLSTLLAAAGLYFGYNVTTDHLSSGWPEHAKFHAALGGMYMLGLSGLILALAWGPYRLRGKGAAPPLALGLLVMPLSFLGAISVVPAGNPGAGYVQAAAVALVVAIVASVLAWRR